MNTDMTPLKVAIVVGSTRPGRHSADVAAWAKQIADRRGDAAYEIVDLADHPLPLLDEALPPLLGAYERPHTKHWAATVAHYDAFVFVTPEYNRSIPAVLKNALDFLFAEWNDKAAGIVAYGADNGARAAEGLRTMLGELMVADVRQHVGFSLHLDFEDYRRFTPRPHGEECLSIQLDELVAWGTALRSLRASRSVSERVSA